MDNPPKSKWAAIPPATLEASIKSTSCPSLSARWAAARPIAPAPMTTTLAIGCSKIQDDARVARIEKRFGKRVPERRCGHTEDSWPIDDRKGFGNDKSLQLFGGERRIGVEFRVNKKQPPEQSV